MTTEQTALTRLQPDVIQVESMGIGLYNTNDTLNLSSNQYLVVGEGRDVGSTGSHVQHNLIVDNSGIAINSDLITRESRGYALYVKGDVLVEGLVRSSGFNSNIANTVNQNTLFQPVIYSTFNNIYSTNLVSVVQSELQARSNTYKFNILSTPNLDIEKSQFNIQNNQLSQFRLAILGNDKYSPVVFNTPSNVPIEFHVGRSKSYFANTYQRAELDNTIVSTQLPHYLSSNDAPHVTIDSDGNVGIRTNRSKTFTYTVPISNPSDTAFIEYKMVTEPMALYVDAPMFAKDILIFDKYTNVACNLDSLYIRSVGQSINPSIIRPGTFAYGPFMFTSNVSIGNDLFVEGSINAHSNVYVNQKLFANNAELNNLIGYQPARFTDAVTVDNTLTASNVLRFGSLLQTLDENGQWVNVDFNVRRQNLTYSNIEEIGTNVFVRNRMAVGINLSNVDELSSVFHHQFAIEKGVENRYELELWDRTLAPFNRKVAVIGHGAIDPSMKYYDGSMVFATGTSTEEYYNALGKNYFNIRKLPQNIYFYPGQYEHSNVYKSLVRPDNPPILGIFENKKVGIGTFSPIKDFHLQGDTFISGDIFVNHAQQLVPLAKIYQDNSIPYIANSVQYTFKGIKYVNEEAPHVGFNTAPDYRYGVVIDKGLKVKGGYYDEQDIKLGNWYESPIGSSKLYTNKETGINVTDPQYALDVYDPSVSRPTTLNIRANQTEVSGAFNYTKGGLRMALPGQTWAVEAGLEYPDKSKVKQSFAVYDTRSTKSNVLIAGQYFSDGRHQTYIGDIYDKGYYGNSNVTYDDTLIVGGHATVFGSLRVTKDLDVDGNIKIRGTSVTISPELVACNIMAIPNPNDVMIAGRIIHMLPVAPNPSSSYSSTSEIDQNRDAYVSIGYTQDTDATVVNKSDYSTYPILRVHQYINSPVVARFSSDYSLAQIDMQAAGGARLRFGLDVVNNKSTLVFVDRTNPSIPRYFLKSVNDSVTNTLTGFNLPETGVPNANLHVYNSDQGKNMMLLQFSSTSLDTVYSPSLVLNKVIPSYNESRYWMIEGPKNPSLQNQVEKLSFTYGSNLDYSREILTLTKDGYIGIGNTLPSYTLDIQCTRNTDGIRLYNPNNTTVPMLVFQSGPSNTYGQDSFYDYRMFSSSNAFYLKQAYNAQDSTLIHFNEFGNMGVKTDANPNYALNVSGFLNISDGILLNGTPFVFKRESSNILTGITVDDNGNIYINPASFFGSPTNEGHRAGVVVGGSVATSNLFHVYSGSNANMMVYDSLFPEAQVHFRTRNKTTGMNSTYRIHASNQVFAFEYNPQHSTESEITDGHAEYIPMVSMQYNPGMVNPPQFHLQGDLNFVSNVSAIRFPQVSVVSTSAGSLVFLPASNIGIGTTLPLGKLDIHTNSSSASLNVTQLGTGYIASFQGSNPNSMLVITPDGNVGIGTFMPRQKLYVHGDVSANFIYPNGSNTTDIGSTQKPWRNLYLDKTLSISGIELSLQTKVLDVTDGTENPYPLRYSKWYIDKPDQTGNNIIIERSPDAQTPYSHAYFDVVMSNELLNSETSRLRPVLFSPLDNRVGINTLSPQALLHVEVPQEMVGESFIIRSRNASNILSVYDQDEQRVFNISESGTIGLGSNATSTAQVTITGSNSTSVVHVQQKSFGDILSVSNSLCNVLVLKNNGYLGIGTTLPQSNVHIEGNLKVSGNIIASNLEVMNIKTMDVEISYSEQSIVTNAGSGPAFTVVQVGQAPIAEFRYGPIGQNKDIAMTLTNTGFVGIGTGLPQYSLDVNGTIQTKRILYGNAFSNLTELTTTAPASKYPGLYAGLQEAGALRPYYSSSNAWDRIALFTEIAEEVDRNRGLQFTVLPITSTNPNSNIVFSGPGIYSKNSNNTEFKLYRGFDYTFKNTSTTLIEFVRKTVGITSLTLSGYNTVSTVNDIYNSNYAFIGSGFGYSNPIVVFEGGEGELAQASMKVNGHISGYDILRAGLLSKPIYSFITPPTACIDPAVLTQLNDTYAPRIKLYLDGRVQPIEFIEFPGLDKVGIQGQLGRGSNLSNVSLSFQLTPGETIGEGAEGYPIIRGSISNIFISDIGSGYSNALVRMYDSNLGTQGSAVATARVIGDIRVLDPVIAGSGYSNPILEYTSSENNYSFHAHPILSAEIQRVHVTNPGYGYSNPTIQITNTPGNMISSLAEFDITVIGGISNLILLEEGAGYSNPEIQTTYLNAEAGGTRLIPALRGSINKIHITSVPDTSGPGGTALYSNVSATISESSDEFFFEPDVSTSTLYGVYIYEGGEGYNPGETVNIRFEDVCRDALKSDGANAGECVIALSNVDVPSLGITSNLTDGKIHTGIYAMIATNPGTRYMRVPESIVEYKPYNPATNFGSNAKAVAILVGDLGLMQCLPNTETISKSLQSDYSSNINFGKTIDMDYNGTTIIIGAYGDGTDRYTGNKAYIYTYNSNEHTWSCNVMYAQDTFPYASNYAFKVSLSGNAHVAGVSAPLIDLNGDSQPDGKVEIYTTTNQGLTWDLASTLYSQCNYSEFGYSTDIDYTGNTIAVSSPNYLNMHGTNTGCVEIFRRNETSWERHQVLSNVSPSFTGPYFGHSIAISGNASTLVVGSPNLEYDGITTGCVSLYTVQQDGKYGLLSNLIPSDYVNEYNFGTSVACDRDGKAFIIGTSSNVAFIYNRTGSNLVETRLTSPYSFKPRIYGSNVGISPDGYTAFVQEVETWDIEGGYISKRFDRMGTVHIYKYSNKSNSWNYSYYLRNGVNVSVPYDFFGTSMSSSYDGHKIAVGMVQQSNVVLDSENSIIEWFSNVNHSVKIHNFQVYTSTPAPSSIQFSCNVIPSLTVGEPDIAPNKLTAFMTIQGSISNVFIETYGSNIKKTPIINIVDTYTASSNASIYPMLIGSISNVSVVHAGMGYSNTLTLTVFENSALAPYTIPASVYADVYGGIYGFIYYNHGSNYVNHPSFNIVETSNIPVESGIPITSAVLRPHIIGSLYDITIHNHGSGYSNATISIENSYNSSEWSYFNAKYGIPYPELTPASAFAEVRGYLDSIVLTNSGSNYSVAPQVVFVDNQSNLSTLLPNVSCRILGALCNIEFYTDVFTNMDGRGYGFFVPPTLTINENDTVYNAITINALSNLFPEFEDDYDILRKQTYEPNVTLTINGPIYSISLDNPGKNYTSLPDITIYENSNSYINTSATVNCNIDTIYIGVDIGMVHSDVTKRPIYEQNNKIFNTEQVVFTVPMDAPNGSNYKYRVVGNSNLAGDIVIV